MLPKDKGKALKGRAHESVQVTSNSSEIIAIITFRKTKLCQCFVLIKEHTLSTIQGRKEEAMLTYWKKNYKKTRLVAGSSVYLRI
jgi:hypothetical protein